MTTPDIGVSIVDTRVLAHLGVKLKPNTCFGIVSGAHTYFLAADTPEEARRWVKALRSTWVHCFKHTLRGTDHIDSQVQETSRLMAYNQLLTQSLREMEGKAAGADSEYWKCWLEEKAKNRQLEEQMVDLALYEVEVKTGKMKGADTDARVYIEMHGPYDQVTTGELRLVNADTHQRSYTRDGLDLFLVTAKNVGLPNSIKVWHDNTGRHPDWFLEYIRIRKKESVSKLHPTERSFGHSTPSASPSKYGAAPGSGGKFLSASKTGTRGAIQGSPSVFSPIGSAGRASIVASPHKPAFTPKGTSAWAVFPCGRWLSTTLEDCRISRTLFAGHSTPLIQYKVEVETSDLRGAGTEANVHLIMHGTLGDGKRHQLTSGPEDFTRGVTNEFTIDDEELGELLEITIGHDNTGHSASWHLDHVIILNCKTDESFLFPCRQWFDTRIGDGAVERRLATGDSMGKITNYIFKITTSDIRGAGTDADVHVALHGDLGDTPTTLLPSRPEHFERMQTDEFQLQLPSVGKIRTLTVGHNNRGPGPDWHLQMVEVYDEDADKTYYFPCNKWLGLGVGDNLLERTLVAVEEDPRHLLTDYRLEFYTSKIRGAGTDATVYFQLIGDSREGEVTRIVAPKEAFERGTVDTFTFKFSHLGKLNKLLVQHDNSGANPAWHLFKVDVYCAKDKATTVFVCNGWIRSNQAAIHPSVELLAGRPIPLLTNYRIDIITADTRGSGTTSNVYAELVGEMGKIGPLPLDNPEAFEKGQRDIFEIEGPDCGPLTQLILTLDGAGNRPSWNLDHVLVYRDASIEDKPDDSQAVYFPCRQWFNKEMGMAKALFPMKKGEDGRLDYTVRVQTSDVKGAGTDSNIFISLVGDKGETGYQPLVANHDTFERGSEDVFPLQMHDVGRPTILLVKSDGASRKPTWHLDTIILESPGAPPAYFVGQCWIGPSTRMEIKIPVTWTNPKEDLGTYKVHVYTSDVKNAGTDAGILIEIFGDRASSGKQPLLDMAKDTFERNQMDEFKIQCKNLGGLRSIRIESDGRSNKPSWHMDRIVIIAPTGETYFFPYEDWIREGRLKVEIPASFQDPTASRRGYKVVTRTSDVFGAATDSNVFIDIRGALGSTGKVPLKSSARSPFERGQADEFHVKTRMELGELAEIIIGTDYSGRTPAWHLEQVEITETRSGRTWFFDCCQWLDAAEGDKKIERILPAQHYDPRLSRPPPKRLARYQVVVATSDVTGAGTEAKVHLVLFGQDGSDTGRISLEPPRAGVPVFERGHRDIFEIQAAEVDPLSMIRIGHNNAGPDGTGSWHLNFVEVTNIATRAVYHFPCRRWLSKAEDDGRIERDLPLGPPMPEEKSKVQGSTEYVIETITSDLSGAGTDANVACILYGDGGETQALMLESKCAMKNLFERGQTDTFSVSAKDVGELQKLNIWHDNKGLLQGASWALELVIVYPKANPQAKVYFYCGQWLSKEYGLEKVLHASFTDPRLNMPTYTVTVHTSNIAGAGTDARVHINMCGAKGESGARELTGKGNLFEQGKKDTFSLKMMDLGDLQYMDVWTDNSGMLQSPSWHLDYIEVDNSLTGTSTYFPCQAWFDKKLGDGQLKRRLVATHKDPRTFKADYRVSVWTSDLFGAGTDANVFIAMYGDEGEMEKINLANRGSNCFEAGHCDIFEFSNKNVGKLQKIRMGHNNSGLGAAWHLDKVVVENLTSGESSTFVVNKWFSKSNDDFQIERELFPTFSGGVNWRLTIVTGQDRGAGTDADVSVELFGTQGSFGPYQLAAKKGAYENGTHDVFSISAPEIGQIAKLALSHNNKGSLTETLTGATWQVDYAELLNVATGEKYHFDFKCWLDTKHGLRAERPPSSVRGLTVFKSCSYSITFITGPNNDSRMERGNVSFNLLGHTGQTERQTLSLPQMGFQPSRVETCGPLADLPDTGSIRQLELSHTAPEPWFVSEVVAVNETSRAQGRFIVNKLIQPNTPTLIDAVEMPPVDYKVEVHTSDKSKAGTSSQVFVNLYGVNGNTGRCPLTRDPDDVAANTKRGSLPTLCRPSGSQFARNAFDAFIVQGQPDVGPMQQLEVDIDTKGMSPSWHLHEIRVTNMTSGEVGIFTCDQWLSNSEADEKTSRLLDNSNMQAAPPGGPQMNTGDVGGRRDQSSPPPAYPGQVPFTQSLIRKMGGSVGQPGYEITFHTSNLIMAGTSAPVFFELIGDVGSSGTVTAKQTQGQFSRGCSDTFVYPRLPFLGELRQVRVGTTGEGAYPTWHLRNVEVYHEGTQSKFVFDCHNWIDKKCGFARVLVANRIQ